MNGNTFKLHVCRLGFHVQAKPDYDAFVKAVRQPRNVDRAGSAAQTKKFEKSLKSAASQIKDEISKAMLALNAQAQVARWNIGVMAPGQMSMPPALIGATTTTTFSAVPGSVEQFILNSDEDASDQDHTGDEDEGGDEQGVGLAA